MLTTSFQSSSHSVHPALLQSSMQPLARPRRQQSLLSRLVSGQGSLMCFDAAQVDQLQAALAVPVSDRAVLKEMKLLMHTGFTRLRLVRENGLPVLQSETSFEFPVERDYVLHASGATLDPAEMNRLAAHAKQQLLNLYWERTGEHLSGNHAQAAYSAALAMIS